METTTQETQAAEPTVTFNNAVLWYLNCLTKADLVWLDNMPADVTIEGALRLCPDHGVKDFARRIGLTAEADAFYAAACDYSFADLADLPEYDRLRDVRINAMTALIKAVVARIEATPLKERVLRGVASRSVGGVSCQ